ncbi:hypothetical protein V8F20_010606 [Naviculisporaceae sp. PSN 640]
MVRKTDIPKYVGRSLRQILGGYLALFPEFHQSRDCLEIFCHVELSRHALRHSTAYGMENSGFSNRGMNFDLDKAIVSPLPFLTKTNCIGNYGVDGFAEPVLLFAFHLFSTAIGSNHHETDDYCAQSHISTGDQFLLSIRSTGKRDRTAQQSSAFQHNVFRDYAEQTVKFQRCSKSFQLPSPVVCILQLSPRAKSPLSSL